MGHLRARAYDLTLRDHARACYFTRVFRYGGSIRGLEWIVVTVLALLISLQVFWPRPIGMADNGDYAKITASFGIWPAPANVGQFWEFFYTDGVIDDHHIWKAGLPSTELAIAAAGRLVAPLLLPRGRFDMRIFGALHLAVLLVAAWLFVRSTRDLSPARRLIASFLILLVLSDALIVQYLNTPYMDTAAIVFGLLMFAAAVNAVTARTETQWQWALVFGVSSALFLASKLQYEACAIPILLFCGAMAWRSLERRTCGPWVVAGMLAASTLVWMNSRMSTEYRSLSMYNLVFAKLIPLSPNATQELGLLPEDKQYARAPLAFLNGSAMYDESFRRRFSATVTPPRIARFYLHHPDIAVKVVLDDLRISTPENRGIHMGVFRRADNSTPRAQPQRFIWWSDFRSALLRVAPMHLVLILVPTLLGSVIWAFWRRHSIAALLMLGSMTSILTFLIASLADSGETPRHLIFFHIATDFVFVALICCVDPNSIRSWRERRTRQKLLYQAASNIGTRPLVTAVRGEDVR
jgi:hypothetical protein